MPAGRAQDLDPGAAVARLFTEEEMTADGFAPAFLAEVPVEQMAAIVADLTGRFGTLVAVDPAGDAFVTRLERAEMPTLVVLDEEGRIAGL